MQWEFWDYDASANFDNAPVKTVKPKSTSSLMARSPSKEGRLELPLIKKQASERSTSLNDDVDSMFMFVSSQDLLDLKDSSNDEEKTSTSHSDDEADHRQHPTTSSVDEAKSSSNRRRRTVASEHPVWINKWQGKFRKSRPDVLGSNYGLYKSTLDKILPGEDAGKKAMGSIFTVDKRPNFGAPPAA